MRGAAGCAVSTQYGVKFMVDTLAKGQGSNEIWLAFTLLVALMTADNFLWRAAGWIASYAFVGVSGDLRGELFRHLTGHAPSFFSDRRVGSLTGRVTATSNAVFTVQNMFIWNVLPPCIATVGAVIYLSFVDALMTGCLVAVAAVLLYGLFNSIRDSLIALSGIPFAVAGGILGLYVAGLNASVSAAVGFISLFGVSAMDGILLVSYIRRGIEQGRGSENAIINAGQTRMRQVFMTGFSACIGLVPAAVSTGIGSQVQQPLACVIVGGMFLSPFCSLLVIPAFSRMFMPAVPRTGDAPAGHAAVH